MSSKQGLYVHIPFCKKACRYCNFYFSVSLQNAPMVSNSIIREIQLRHHELPDARLDTLYFGGGTPSHLPAEHLKAITHEIRNRFDTHLLEEFTLEANPEDAVQNPSLWSFLKDQLGVTRISLGVQSFRNEDLQYMGRAHEPQEALQAIRAIGDLGMELSIDLIYGTPGMEMEDWKKNLDIFLGLNIPHLSAYALTVEPKTALERDIKKLRSPAPADAKTAEQFEYLIETMEANGYEQYEISNFARPGHRSRHNSGYWSGMHYLGIGPSAHSYNGLERSANVSNNLEYIRKLQSGTDAVHFREILSAADRINETIMLGLRKKEGISLSDLEEHIQQAVTAGLTEIPVEYYELTSTHLRLTPQGRLFADGIASALFVEA